MLDTWRIILKGFGELEEFVEFFYRFLFLFSFFFRERERRSYINNETFRKCMGRVRSIVKTAGMSQSIVCMREPTSSTVIQTVSKR